mgnify:CR=1 FL=1
MAIRPSGYRRFFLHAPRTLLWRIFLLVAALILISVAMWSAIFNHFDEAGRARQIAQTVSSIVNLTRSALLNADPALRRELLMDLATLEGIRIYPAEKQDRTEPLADTSLFHEITAEVRRQLGSDTRFASAWEGLPGFWVSFRLEGETAEDSTDFWVLLPPERVIRPHTREWLGWGAAALCLAMLGAYVIVSRLNRPLRQMATAAAMVGRGETPPRLDEDGPLELADLARAFNQMSRDLQELDADRALILAGVSHDLRTPLARLRLGIEMSGASSADVDAMVSDIEDMDRIIGQFLEFSRSDGGEPLDTVALHELARELSTHYARRGTQLSIAAEQPAFARARPQALRRAVINLVENALRYAGDSPALEVGIEQLQRRYGFKLLLVTLGGEGVMLATPAEPLRHLPTRKVQPVDTTGAGDAFVAVAQDLGDLSVVGGHGQASSSRPRQRRRTSSPSSETAAKRSRPRRVQAKMAANSSAVLSWPELWTMR